MACELMNHLRSQPWQVAWGVLLLALSAGTARLGAQPVLSLGTDGAAQGHIAAIPLGIANTTNLAGVQLDLLFDSGFARSDGFGIAASVPGALADCAVVAPGRLRVVVLSTNREPLPVGVVARVMFAAQTNAPNGLVRVPVRRAPDHAIVGATSQAGCVTAAELRGGQFLVGDAFGFIEQGGRVQFCAPSGADYVIQASTNLCDWQIIGTNSAFEDLVVWIDQDTAQYPCRFYRLAEAPPAGWC